MSEPSTPTDAALRAALSVLVEQWREHAGNMWLHSDTAAGVRACAAELDAALRATDPLDRARLTALADDQLRMHGFTGTFCACTCELCDIARGHKQAEAEVTTLRGEVARLTQALTELRIDANRLCDRQLGGTYEEDCRRSIAKADAALRGATEERTT